MPEPTRYAYALRHSDGSFVSSRRFSHRCGTTRAKSTDVKFARLFNRKHDAVSQCPEGCEVVTFEMWES